jgi:hypothetical protein
MDGAHTINFNKCKHVLMLRCYTINEVVKWKLKQNQLFFIKDFKNLLSFKLFGMKLFFTHREFWL